MAALDRALALPEVDDGAVRVAEHLHLDVPRLLDELLDEHPVVAERGPRFVLAADESFPGFGVRARDAQALPAAAGARLDHHRIADLARDLDRLRGVADHVGIARDRVDLRLLGELLGGDLVAHAGDRLDVRADEGDAGLLERPGERFVLGQEAVAGMDGLGAGLLARLDDPVDHQIALRRGRRTDRRRLVRARHVQRVLVRLRVHRDGLDAHPARGADHPAGDLAAVRDQDLLEHRGRRLLRAGCWRACARGWKAACPSASPATGRSAGASRAA